MGPKRIYGASSTGLATRAASRNDISRGNGREERTRAANKLECESFADSRGSSARYSVNADRSKTFGRSERRLSDATRPTGFSRFPGWSSSNLHLIIGRTSLNTFLITTPCPGVHRKIVDFTRPSICIDCIQKRRNSINYVYVRARSNI